MQPNDDSDEGGPGEPPRGVTKRRRGWEGEEMEMVHQREAFREDKGKASAAVDISQFQNHEVGKGYQAKHVVRQKTGEAPSVKTKDMSGGNNGVADSKAKAPKRSSNEISEIRASYMKSAGLREFRKEIEKILSS
jgi:hypothetical protein